MNFRPLHDRVLIQRTDPERVSAGGVIVPDAAQEKALTATVLAVGEGFRSDGGEPSPLTVKPGDRVLFAKFAGDEIKIDGEEYIVLRESDILGVFDAAEG